MCWARSYVEILDELPMFHEQTITNFSPKETFALLFSSLLPQSIACQDLQGTRAEIVMAGASLSYSLLASCYPRARLLQQSDNCSCGSHGQKHPSSEHYWQVGLMFLDAKRRNKVRVIKEVYPRQMVEKIMYTSSDFRTGFLLPLA